MAFVYRLATSVPSQGSPVMNDTFFYRTSVNLTTTGAQTNTLPTTGVWTPTIHQGLIRVRFVPTSGSGATPAVATCVLVLSDGTTFVEVARLTTGTLAVPPAAGTALAPNFGDRVVEFLVDINATSLSVITTLSGTAPIVNMDIELSGTA